MRMAWPFEARPPMGTLSRVGESDGPVSASGVFWRRQMDGEYKLGTQQKACKVRSDDSLLELPGTLVHFGTTALTSRHPCQLVVMDDSARGPVRRVVPRSRVRN